MELNCEFIIEDQRIFDSDNGLETLKKKKLLRKGTN